MKRINGYLVLDEQSVLQDGKVLKCYLNNEKFYFKFNNINPYIEVLSSVVAEMINIKTVVYDLAMYQNNLGVISKTFNPLDLEEIPLYKIIYNYRDKYTCISGYNLECIWEALDFYYKDYENRKEIVREIMNDIVDAFILQIILNNNDLNAGNLRILNGMKPELASNFDYNYVSYKYSYLQLRAINNKGLFFDNFADVIKGFLQVSASFYGDYLWEKVENMPDVKSVIQIVENRIGCFLPPLIKEEYFKGYQEHQQKLCLLLK